MTENFTLNGVELFIVFCCSLRLFSVEGNTRETFGFPLVIVVVFVVVVVFLLFVVSSSCGCGGVVWLSS